MSNTFQQDVNGASIRPAYHFDTYLANEKLSAAIPFAGVPQSSHGTRIFSGAIQVPAGRSVEISMNGIVLHMNGTTAMAACWFVDDETSARGTMAINHIGAGYMAGIHLHDLYTPPDGEPHTIHVHVGPASGEMVTNGMNPATGPQMYGGTLTATFFLKEL